ncbi:hypothetical protein SSYM_1513, partial [Serratia symbiotica str. Tucson]
STTPLLYLLLMASHIAAVSAPILLQHAEVQQIRFR